MAATATVLAVLSAVPATASGPSTSAPLPDLHLVTLTGAGTSGSTHSRAELLAGQDAVLADLVRPGDTPDGLEPVYRWTTALNGFAVRLDRGQVATLEDDPRVALVEPNDVRRTATTSSGAGAAGTRPPARGGAGTVIGVVGTGISPELPVFADVPGLGREPRDFRGGCEPAEEWSASSCGRKLVGASWFVDGFGTSRVGTSESLSPRDGSGGGSQLAALAAGNARVTMRLPQGDPESGRTFGGAAPQARVAAYKACWTAPDPADDGCATADLVTAVDRATADGVDVLTLGVDGPSAPTPGVDTLDRALLGATEAETVVVAAAGTGSTSYAAHGVPWVTTVGATSGPPRAAAVVVPGVGTFTGAGRIGDGMRGPLVESADAAAPDTRTRDARVCRPGSLDASKVRGAIVVCERGGTARVDKSAAVAAAGGAGMVLANDAPARVHADLHHVPTVHLDVEQARDLRASLRTHRGSTGRLVPSAATDTGVRVPAWSPVGDPRGGVLKPDVVALGSGLLAPRGGSQPWQHVAGTGAATARVAGVAARFVAATGWDAERIRSALSGAGRRVAGPGGSVGSGELGLRAQPPRLVLDEDPAAYRRVLEGDLTVARLNQPGVLLSGGNRVATRTLTNTGPRPEYFSVRVAGRPGVTVSPAALRLDPGERGTFTVRTTTPTASDRSGALVWRGARGSVTRIGVRVSR